jgi:hypothetical protein
MVNCKKIVFRRPLMSGVSILLGVIIYEDDYFYKLVTGRGKEHIINKETVLICEDTNTPFIQEEVGR